MRRVLHLETFGVNMPMQKALAILSLWLNYILGNNNAIIAYTVCWGVIFFNVNSQNNIIYITLFTHFRARNTTLVPKPTICDPGPQVSILRNWDLYIIWKLNK